MASEYVIDAHVFTSKIHIYNRWYKHCDICYGLFLPKVFVLFRPNSYEYEILFFLLILHFENLGVSIYFTQFWFVIESPSAERWGRCDVILYTSYIHKVEPTCTRRKTLCYMAEEYGEKSSSFGKFRTYVIAYVS